MKKLGILLIFVLAFLGVNLVFAAEQPEMSVFAGDINYGETVQVFITLPADAWGNVTVSVSNQSQVVEIVDGQATANISGLAPGDYKVKVEYNGAGNYSKISKEVDLKVNGTAEVNASGEAADSNNTAPINDTNATNNTAPSKNAEPKQPTTAQSKTDHLKPVTDLAKNPAGLPIILLVLVLMGCIFGAPLRRK